MDIAHLSYFSTLCETLNYTEAARKCFISRQAMRQSVQMLEQTYGIRLIENQHNRLALTPAGEILYDRAQPVLRSYYELNNAMRSCIRSESTLHIGVSRSITPCYAPEVLTAIQRFTETYSGIPVDIVLMTADEIVQKLEEGILEAGVLVETEAANMGDLRAADFPRTLELPLSKRPCSFYRRTSLRRDPLTLLLSVTHPLIHKKSLTLQDLDGQTLMVMGQPETFFLPLYRAVLRQNIHVNWQIVPDFYEVSYRILQDNCLAIDRQDSSGYMSTDVDRNLPLEDNAFILSCNLLTPEKETAPIQFLRQALLTELGLAERAAGTRESVPSFGNKIPQIRRSRIHARAVSDDT